MSHKAVLLRVAGFTLLKSLTLRVQAYTVTSTHAAVAALDGLIQANASLPPAQPPAKAAKRSGRPRGARQASVAAIQRQHGEVEAKAVLATLQSQLAHVAGVAQPTAGTLNLIQRMLLTTMLEQYEQPNALDLAAQHVAQLTGIPLEHTQALCAQVWSSVEEGVLEAERESDAGQDDA